MTRLQPFQQDTVDAAVEALSRPAGSRRFLVADEVGLGKTVVARAIAQRLKTSGETLNIFYLCPSLEIAAQNRDKFNVLTGLTREEQAESADRLSLLLRYPPPAGNGFRILSLTPETSLPSWKPGSRTGRKTERTLIWNLIRHSYPVLAKEIERLDRGRNKSRPLFEPSREDVSSLARHFDHGLRTVFGCPERHRLEPLIESWLDQHKDVLEFVSRARSALAFAALSRKAISPDLLILDEFHRYADLIAPTTAPADKRKPFAGERKRVHDLLIDKFLNGHEGRPPATLLLSATPYQLNRLDGSQLYPSRRYGSLIQLVKYLYGGRGPGKAKEAEDTIDEYHRALVGKSDREEIIASIRAAKSKLELILKPIIARTERALASDEDLFDRRPVQTSLSTADIRVFRHLARSVPDKDRHLRVWTTPLWCSVPYPAQTLHGYAIWKSLKSSRAPVTIDNSRKEPAHPQYRELCNTIVNPSSLSLPWLRPSLPWWRLEGAWKETAQQAGKTLLFSKFRAVPTALSALLSMPVDELAFGPPNNRQGKGKPQPYLRPRAGLNHALLAMFTPWPVLSQAIDPRKDGAASIASVKNEAEKQLGQWMRQRGIQIKQGPKRSSWRLALSLETNGNAAATKGLLRALGGAGLKSTLEAWSVPEPIERISNIEIRQLAAFLLCAPGAIVSRSLHRHGILFNDEKNVRRAFNFCWKNLRTYLGQRYFKRIVLGRFIKGRYPESLMSAMLKGGFEAVLDEQIALLRLLGDKHGTQIIDELGGGLLDRPGLVRIRRKGNDKNRVRVHAATPFAGGERRGGGHNKKDQKLRSDTLRRAFNSPFWPHVLSTTSVGQEGLDFHYWCDKIVHWDLPAGPVEFEQREGRISRYSSLTVRRVFVAQYAEAAYSALDRGSPFVRIFDAAHAAEDDGIGLERWWTPRSQKPTSFTFKWNFSIRQSRIDKLQKELLYYRLGIGQPEPDAFTKLLEHLGATRDEARTLALNLSPSSSGVA